MTNPRHAGVVSRVRDIVGGKDIQNPLPVAGGRNRELGVDPLVASAAVTDLGNPRSQGIDVGLSRPKGCLGQELRGADLAANFLDLTGVAGFERAR